MTVRSRSQEDRHLEGNPFSFKLEVSPKSVNAFEFGIRSLGSKILHAIRSFGNKILHARWLQSLCPARIGFTPFAPRIAEPLARRIAEPLARSHGVWVSRLHGRDGAADPNLAER